MDNRSNLMLKLIVGCESDFNVFVNQLPVVGEEIEAFKLVGEHLAKISVKPIFIEKIIIDKDMSYYEGLDGYEQFSHLCELCSCDNCYEDDYSSSIIWGKVKMVTDDLQVLTSFYSSDHVHEQLIKSLLKLQIGFNITPNLKVGGFFLFYFNKNAL